MLPESGSLIRYMSERRPKTDDVKYQAYLDERKSLVEWEHTIASHFDKSIFALAAGALGISLVFIEKIAPEPDSKTLILLYLSWLSLVLSLSTTLSALLTGQHAFRRARSILEDEFFPEGEKKSKNQNCWSTGTQILNWSSIIFFIIGVGTLALFSIQNVKANLADKKSASAITTTAVMSNEQQATK